MRIVLVGPASRRAHLRALLTDEIEVVGEVTTVSEARRIRAVDGYLVAPSAAGREDQVVEPLTARELEVLGHLADGLSNKAIASRLGISDETVKFHLSAIFGKLGASNRTDAVRQAVRRGLVVV
jgi:ATP/maltotriose-dependent transcriptional regulator MalT